MKRLVVLVSGFGSNLQAIMDGCSRGDIGAEVAAVVANRQAAFGLERAREAGIPSEHLGFKSYRDAGHSREDYDADLAALVSSYAPDFVILAGWMRVLTPAFLNHFGDRVINLHPALPGHFPGIRAIERALAAFQAGEIRQTGVMVHRVVPEVDAGPVLATVEVPIRPGDTLDDLAARIHAAEHPLLVKVVGDLCAL
jgi:formyltetrahydrofolate-dependent phosphoribosylglycinamide formyltransferase